MNTICPCSDCLNGQHEKRTEHLSEKQVEILEAAYRQWPQPFPELLSQLVKETGIKSEELLEWFRKKNETNATECFNMQVKHGRQTKKEDIYLLANSKSVESSNTLEVNMELTKINVKRADAKKKNENYSKRPLSKVSKVASNKMRVNVKLKPKSNEKKNNDSVVEIKDSQNFQLSTENDEIDTKCQFCTEYFHSRTKLFIHMIIHVPPGIKENLPNVEGELAWCPYCPGPVSVAQVNSHVAKCHTVEDVGVIERIEDSFELEEIKCDERNLVGSGIPNLMVESAPVWVKFIPEESGGKCIVNLMENVS